MNEYNIKHKAWADINLDALGSNYTEICRLAGQDTKVMCVVKADAYGHGAVKCATALYRAGAEWFAVSSLEEAVEIREALASRLMYGAKILILGYTPVENAGILSRLDIRQTVFSAEYARALSRAAEHQSCRVKVHFKLDTGMNRIGFDCGPLAAEEIAEASGYKGLLPEGLFTHFACSDEDDPEPTRLQFERFMRVDEELEVKGVRLLCHVCNSAAILKFPEYHLDMVRAGIILYGLEPYFPMENEKLFQPVMSFKSVVSHIHTVHAGESVGYGGTYTADKNITVATIPIGYADGFMRKFSSGGVVYIKGKPAPIIGRVCMDQCMVDISGIYGVEIGDEVTIFGEDKSMLRNLARVADTINYELVCLIGKRVPRIYTD
ncbi:MAG: alanine racemase [Clostridiales bacterium]|nr:alanine racemase [Clostridiales bacterium]